MYVLLPNCLIHIYIYSFDFSNIYNSKKLTPTLDIIICAYSLLIHGPLSDVPHCVGKPSP